MFGKIGSRTLATGAITLSMALFWASTMEGQGRKPVATSTPSANAKPRTEKATCLRAYEQGQRLRKTRKLRDARQELITCASDGCPVELRADCGRWLTELEAETPSVVFAAKSPDGRDLIDVEVSAAGQVLARKLDGKAIDLDPGQYRFKFEAQGQTPVEQDVVVREREKGRSIAIHFPSAGSAAAQPSRSLLPYVLGAAGVVGLGMFVGFGLHGRSLQHELDDRGCKPNCPQSDVDAMNRAYVIADISLGIGLLSLGAATYLLVRQHSSKASEPRVSWTAGPMPGGLITGFRGSF